MMFGAGMPRCQSDSDTFSSKVPMTLHMFPHQRDIDGQLELNSTPRAVDAPYARLCELLVLQDSQIHF